MKGLTATCVILLMTLMLTGCTPGNAPTTGMADKAALDVETANARMLRNIGAICITNGEITAGTYDSPSDSPAIAKYLDGKWPKLRDGRTPMQLIITMSKKGEYSVTTNAECDTATPK